MNLKHIVLGLSMAATCLCSDVWTGTVTFNGTEPLNSNRIFRDATPSTWAAPKAFPGTSPCAAGTCYFKTVTLPPTDNQFIRVTTNTGTTLFGSAYNNTFSLANLATNYLGDAGSSNGVRVFKVILPYESQLVLVFNTIFVPADLGSIDYTVEAFYTDSELDKRLFDSFFFN
jgi:hypothetical protein